ncbi:hypothetical protein EJB05_29931, partial [Eragrostis curvula]
MEGAGAKQAACAGAGSGASDPGPPPRRSRSSRTAHRGGGRRPHPARLQGRARCKRPTRRPGGGREGVVLVAAGHRARPRQGCTGRRVLERINKQQGPKAKKLCLKRTLTGPWGTTDISAPL